MPKNRLRSSAIALGAASMLVLSLAACTGPSPAQSDQRLDSAGEQALSRAKDFVEKSQAKVTDAALASDSPAIATDISIVVVPCTYAAEGCKRVADSVQEAGKTLGWDTRMVDPAGDPEKMRQAIRTATQLKVDGIVLGAIPEILVKDDVALARAAGIKVVNAMEPNSKEFSDAQTGTDNVLAGRMNAALLTVETGGLGQVITINDPQFPAIIGWHTGFTEGLKEFCPSCTIVKEMEFQLSGLQTTLPQEFQATLTANPEVNAVWAAYDPVVTAITPVIERSSNPDIKIVSHNADPSSLKDLKSGNKPVVGSVGYSIEWIGYSAMDQMNRLLSDSLSEDDRQRTVPNKLITSSNVTTVPWDGDADWKNAFLTAWKSDK
ncbi:sugar ABC transporter substrate-binding protein [Paeniglutamicibacter sp. ORCA_105]|uniref:sugar ABC transporter substrate-binding protein n=1 Tax=Paeniglutamicibacter sp. ORCA_105 TaxID=3377336 RepID=UPI0038947038